MQVIPRIAGLLQSADPTQLIEQIFAFRTFGLRFDTNIGEWRIVTPTNIDSASEFSIGKTGDNTNPTIR